MKKKENRFMSSNAQVDKIAWEINVALNASFTGYLSEAMQLGGKLVTCQRILSGELIVETDTLKVLTQEQVEAHDKALAAGEK